MVDERCRDLMMPIRIRIQLTIELEGRASLGEHAFDLTEVALADVLRKKNASVVIGEDLELTGVQVEVT